MMSLLTAALAAEPTLVVRDTPRPMDLERALAALDHPAGSPPLVRAGPVAGGRWLVVDSYGGGAYAWTPGAAGLTALGVAAALDVGPDAFVVHAGGSLAVLDVSGHLAAVPSAVGHAIQPLAVDGDSLIGIDMSANGAPPRAVRLSTTSLTPVGPPLSLSDWTRTSAVTRVDGHLHLALWRRVPLPTGQVDDWTSLPAVELARVDLTTGRVERVGAGVGVWSATDVPYVEVEVVFDPRDASGFRCVNVIGPTGVSLSGPCLKL